MRRSTNGISNTEDNNFYPFAYAGVACFAVMGLFNFTVQAIPVMLLFVVYIAFCIVGNQATSKYQLLPIKIAIPITCIAVLCFFKLTYTAKAYRTCKTTKESVEEIGTTKAINKLASLETELHSSVFYWRSYGSLLYQQKKYQQALEKYKNATEFSSDPELLSMIGTCYLKIGNYATAAEAYNLMQYIQRRCYISRRGI